LLQTTNFVIEGCEITNALLSHFSYLCRGKNRNRDQRSRNYKGQAESALQQQQNFPLFLDSHKPVWPCGRRFFWNGRVQILVLCCSFGQHMPASTNFCYRHAPPSDRSRDQVPFIPQHITSGIVYAIPGLSPAHYFRCSLSYTWL